jgi:hypothetical protein
MIRQLPSLHDRRSSVFIGGSSFFSSVVSWLKENAGTQRRQRTAVFIAVHRCSSPVSFLGEGAQPRKTREEGTGDKQ